MAPSGAFLINFYVTTTVSGKGDQKWENLNLLRHKKSLMR